MGRHIKYTEDHIDKVQQYIKLGLTRQDAIKKAGFSDNSLFYLALKRYKYRVEIYFVKDGGFL
jgi:hypothetical protein